MLNQEDTPFLVDSHCHLDFPDFKDELEEVVTRAGEAGIKYMVTICTHVTRFAQVRAVSEQFPNIFCTVGVHPHQAGEEPPVTTEDLMKLAQDPRVVGIGETGLDFHYDNAPRDEQERNFRAHIGAARETGLPLIVHTRDADDETVRVMTEEYEKGAYPALIHCFSAGPELARRVVEMGFHISISGIITFKNAEALRDIVRGVPLDRLLVETDSPYLAPVPKRGKRNEPAFTAFTAARVAGLLDVSLDRLARATTRNFFNLFGKARLIVEKQEGRAV